MSESGSGQRRGEREGRVIVDGGGKRSLEGAGLSVDRNYIENSNYIS